MLSFRLSFTERFLKCFSQNSNTIVKKPKTVLTSAQALRGEVSRSLFDRKPKSTSTSVNCDLLDSTIHSHDGRRRHSLDLSDSLFNSIRAFH